MSGEFGNEDLLWDYWYSVLDDIIKARDDLDESEVMKMALDSIAVWVNQALDEAPDYIVNQRKKEKAKKESGIDFAQDYRFLSLGQFKQEDMK